MFRKTLLSLGLLGSTAMLHAQASPTASRAGDVLVGAGYSSANSDYGPRYTGFMAFGDFDFRQHFGVEAAFHYVSAPKPNTLYEKTYEIGGRYFRTYGPLVPYGKVMVGRGVFNYPPLPPPANQNVAAANLAYNMVAGGLGTDVKVRPWLYVRVDYEFQKWLSFKGTPTGKADSLSPSVLSIGAAYHFR